MTLIRACIFDLDGTLLNTIPAIMGTVNRVLSHYSLPLSTPQQVCAFAGDGAAALIQRMLLHHGGEGALALQEQALSLYLELFKEHSMDGVAPYPGILELLSALKELGIHLAVCSNKPHKFTVANIAGAFPPGIFAQVLGATAERPLKPAPDAPLAIAAALGVAPEECLYIGDTSTDMLTGQNAGMAKCGVLWGFRERKELAAYHPQLLAATPEDILEYIRRQ